MRARSSSTSSSCSSIPRRWASRPAPRSITYVEQVLERAPEPDREAIWLLRQEAGVRASFVAEVLGGGD